MTVRLRAWWAFRIVQACTLGALLWKYDFYMLASRVYADWPLHTRLFPTIFESPTTFLASYAAAIIGLGLTLVLPGWRACQAASVVVLAGLTVLCLHLGGYNDATFTTAWWAAVWATWFAGRLGGASEADLARAALLSRSIVSVVLLGGAVGKWTSEYWSGQVLYEIYFADRDFWLFNWLRQGLDADALRTTATWYSRAVIGVESACGLLLWRLPSRAAAAIGAAVPLGIAALSNSLLFSVVLSLAGLAAAGFADTDPGDRRS